MKNLRTGTAKFDTIRAKDASGLHIQDDAGNGLFIKDGGNVGIGTTNPSAKLHVGSAKVSDYDYLAIFDSTSSAKLRIGDESNAAQNRVILSNNYKRNSTGYTADDDTYGVAHLLFGDGQIKFATAAAGNNVPTDRVTVDSNGNVGIGTTNPGVRLQLANTEERGDYASTYGRFETPDFFVRNTQTGSSIGSTKILIQNIGTSGTAEAAVSLVNELNAAGALAFSLRNPSDNTNIVERMRIASNGNVGIGTTNPSVNLDLKKASNDGGATLRLRSAAVLDDYKTVGSIEYFSDDASTDSTGLVGSIDVINAGTTDGTTWRGDGNNAAMTFNLIQGLAATTSPVEAMRIDSDGNVGIGTTSPDYKLHVDGDVRINNQDKLYIGNEFNYLTSTAINDLNISHNRHLTFSSWSAGVEQTNVTFEEGGNVGIGTTSPSAKTVIKSGVNSLPNSDISADTGTALRILGADEAAIDLGSTGRINNGGVGQWIQARHSEIDSTYYNLLLNPNGGNVGIGTTSPGSYKLHVNGTLKIYDTSHVGAHEITSDDRVKHNEQPIVGALETLSKITPKKYIKTKEMYDANHDFELDADGNPIDENGEPVEHRIEAGVIAQQVLTVDELAFAVSPEGVDEDGVVTSPHGLDYNSLFTYAIAAIQEQQEIIETQNSRIDELISRIETLEQ